MRGMLINKRYNEHENIYLFNAEINLSYLRAAFGIDLLRKGPDLQKSKI